MKRTVVETLFAIVDETGRVQTTVWNRWPAVVKGARYVECDDYVTQDYDYDGAAFKLVRDEHPPADSEPEDMKAERGNIRARMMTALKPAPASPQHP